MKRRYFLKSKLLGLLLPPILSCASCTKTVYVPLQSHSVLSDTVLLMKERADTVLERDTLMLTQRGDTVVSDARHWRWRVRVSRDTLYRVVRDSVRVEVPVPVDRGVPHRSGRPFLVALGILAALLLLAAVYVKRRNP